MKSVNTGKKNTQKLAAVAPQNEWDYQDRNGLWHIRGTDTWTQDDECRICSCCSPTCWYDCNWKVGVNI